VLAQESSGPYHLFAWKEAVEKAYRNKSLYLVADGRDGDIQGLLPLTLVKAPFMKGTLVSQPFCDYGGIFARSEDTAGRLLAKALELAEAHKATLEIRCRRPEPCLQGHPGFAVMSHKSRMLLDIPESSGALWNLLKSKVRSQVRRPEKDGMHFRLGSRELAGDFYTVFARNMRELGSPVHSMKWIESVLDAFRERAHVGIVYKESLPVAGGIILECGDTVSIPWASALPEFSRSSPNMLLYWGFIEYAADSGFKRFDFGRSTPGEGTYRFKAQWGAKPEPLFWYTTAKTDSAGSDAAPPSESPNRKLAAQVWRRLPMSVTRIVGPRVRKYISL
jgi:FemAB-related protein (PEP-CTERM system-associated)